MIDETHPDRPFDGRRTAGAERVSRIRLMLLGLVLFGSVGLFAELLLLEHFEEPYQLVPLVLLAAGTLTGAVLWLRPRRATIQAFRAVMAGLLIAAGLGIWLHLHGNAEFEREMDASAGGLALLWVALRGATPALAPGALAQIGILGLILTYRHPAMRRDPPAGRGAVSSVGR